MKFCNFKYYNVFVCSLYILIRIIVNIINIKLYNIFEMIMFFFDLVVFNENCLVIELFLDNKVYKVIEL